MEIKKTVSISFLCLKKIQVNRPGSDAALPNLKKKSRRVSIAGGDRKKGGF